LRKAIHRTRDHWLRLGSRLSADEREKPDTLSASLIYTAAVWTFKERARELWHKPFDVPNRRKIAARGKSGTSGRGSGTHARSHRGGSRMREPKA
jgi:hypothetical protein